MKKGKNKKGGITLSQKELDWITGDHTGISSKTIFSVNTGWPVKNFDTPHDGWDFGRCYSLLFLFPEWKKNLNKLSKISKEWESLINEWSTLEVFYEEYLSTGDMQIMNVLHAKISRLRGSVKSKLK